jgi:hypothetical protein
MNQFRLWYHEETSCVAILNKNVIFFFFYKIAEQEELIPA